MHTYFLTKYESYLVQLVQLIIIKGIIIYITQFLKKLQFDNSTYRKPAA